MNKYYIKNFKTVFGDEKIVLSTLNIDRERLLDRLQNDVLDRLQNDGCHIGRGKYDFFRIEADRAIDIEWLNVDNWFMWGYNLINIFEDENGYYFMSI